MVCEDAVGRQQGQPCCCEWEVLPGEADGLVLQEGLLEAEGAARTWSELQECLQHSWSCWQQWELLVCVSHHPLSCTRLTRDPTLGPLKSIASSRFVFGHRTESLIKLLEDSILTNILHLLFQAVHGIVFEYSLRVGFLLYTPAIRLLG